MHFESDYRMDMEDNFSMCGQAMSCQSASSTSSAYDPFTPSRRSTPNELGFEFNNPYHSFSSTHSGELTPPPNDMSKYMYTHIKTEPGRSMSFSEGIVPSTPARKMNVLVPGYNHILDIGLASQHAMGSLTPSSSYPVYTASPQSTLQSAPPFIMTPTHSVSGSEMAESSSSWSCANDSPMSLFPHKSLSPQELNGLELDRHSQSPMGRYYIPGPPSPHSLRTQRKMMVHEAQRKTSELQRVQIRAMGRDSDRMDGSAPVDIVRRAMCKCDYPGCNKAFRRNEHLKRHKQTFHGEGPNRFACEFCGKDQFNRQDNLNNHRKLHARLNSRNRGVEYIPAAVAIIEQEERSRKRRAPPKSKQQPGMMAGEKRGDGY